MRKLVWLSIITLASLPTLSLAAGTIDAGTKQATNWTAIGMFVGFVVLTLGITYWAAKRTASAADFYSAGGGITGFQSGLAIAGDYMSAASFLGISGLVYTSGYDGLIYSVGWLVGWPIVIFLIAEQLIHSHAVTPEKLPDGRCVLDSPLRPERIQSARNAEPGPRSNVSLIDLSVIADAFARRGWFNLIKWTLYSLINAEELGVKSATIEDAMKSSNPNIRRLVGIGGGTFFSRSAS